MKVEFDKNGKPYVVNFHDMNKISLLPDELIHLFQNARKPNVIIKERFIDITVLYEVVNENDADWYARKRPGVYVVYQILPEQHIFLKEYGDTHETTVAWHDINWNGFKVLFK